MKQVFPIPSLLKLLLAPLLSILISPLNIYIYGKDIHPSDIPAYTIFNEAVHHEHTLQNKYLALSLYEEALALLPTMPEGLINYGSLLDKLGRTPEAITIFNMLLSTTPDPAFKAGACNNLGHVYHKSVGGQDILKLDHAAAYYSKALTHVHDHIDSMYNLGKVRQELGDFRGALEMYTRVLEIKPEHYLSRLNLGNYYFEVGENHLAVENYKILVSSDSAVDVPSDVLEMGYNNMGQVYRDASLHADAETCFENAMRVSGYESPLALVNYYVARRTLNNWEGLDSITSEMVFMMNKKLRELHSGAAGASVKQVAGLTPYDSTLLGNASPSFRREIAEMFSRPFDYMERVGVGVGVGVGGVGVGGTHQQLTVAYSSYDFRDHPMGHLTSGLVTSHSNKSFFKTVALSYGKDDKSRYRKLFESNVDVFLDAFNQPALTAGEARRSGEGVRKTRNIYEPLLN